ncbi:hypothetical protein DL96DRAFT_1631416 [Flagelloscypha sp. PMI_526]|nr:hypothetical protein DL96DRAFT_1631416 [Flagelloscypha sp. PMI_526]
MSLGLFSKSRLCLIGQLHAHFLVFHKKFSPVSYDSMDRFIESFTSDSPTPRIRRARGYVRSFSTKRYDDDNFQVPNFVRHCSALESLCLWSLEPPHSLFTLNVPSLRRLSFPYPNPGVLPCNMSFLSAVTHLELDAVNGLTIWDVGTGVFAMPSLTHLVVMMTLSISFDMTSVISSVSAHIPPQLEVLLLLLQRAQKNQLEGVAYDDRIILGVLPRLEGIENPPDVASDDVFEDEWNQWSEQVSEENTRWGRAERMMRDKRSKRANLI